MYRPSVSIVSEHAPWCRIGGDVVVEVAVGEPREELVLVDVVGDLAVDEIRELVGAREVVDGDDVGLAARD